MEASDWEELEFLLDSAGIPGDKALGLDETVDDEVPFPSPEEFEANLKVNVKGEEFELLLPDIDDYVPWEAQGIKPPEIITPPPFLDVLKLLVPIEITPEILEEAEFLEKRFEGMKLGDKVNEPTKEITEGSTAEDVSPGLNSNSARSMTPELVVVPEGNEDCSVSVTKTISKPATTQKTAPGNSKFITSSGKPSHIVKEGVTAACSIQPHGKRKLSSKEPSITGTFKTSEEKRPARPSVRIVSKEKKHATNPSIQSMPAKLPGSPRQHAPDKSKSQGSSATNIVSRMKPRLPIKRSREEEAGDAIEISDSSGDSP